MGRGTPPGSAGVPPACTAVASRSGSLRCSTRRPRRPERHGLGRSGAVAGPARNLMGAKPAIRGRFLVERSKPSIAGFVSILPGRMRARRPRSRVGLARDVFAAGNLSSTANPMQGAPSLPLPGSYPLCQVQCGRDARAPGWVPPATFSLQATFRPRPIPCKGRRACLCRVCFHCARSYAGGTPAIPGGLHPLDVIAAREVHRSLYPFAVRPCRRTPQDQILQIPRIDANYPCKPQGVGASHCDSTFYRWPGFALNWVPAVCDSAPSPLGQRRRPEIQGCLLEWTRFSSK